MLASPFALDSKASLGRGAARRCSRAPRGVLTVAAIVTPAVDSQDVPSPSPLPKKRNRIFTDKDGVRIQAMPVDYGFRAGAGRLYQDHYGEIPKSVWELASLNFKHELDQMRHSFRHNPYYRELYARNPPKTLLAKLNCRVGQAMANGLGKVDELLEKVGLLPELKPLPSWSPDALAEFDEIKDKLSKLTICNEAVARREAARIAADGDMEATPIAVKLPFLALCWVLDVVYDKRPIQKFWVLETVARIPYFAYISILHLYESLGFWRAGAELRKIHFAEEWNELHHLQIMESLGGDQAWFDRFLAEHAAVLYYWLLIAFYLVSPKVAYNFMQRVEHHAADTYCEFLESNRELLASIPPPVVALNYYRNQDLYLFDSFQTSSKASGVQRRPDCNTLLDVFINVRDDELEHVATMFAMQNEEIAKQLAVGRGSPGPEDHLTME
ncbi:plastid terminal oxidase [Haematococcus lacustris]